MFILTQLLIPVALLSSVVIGLPLNDDDRIFGGKEAAIGQFPYVAQIRGHTEIGSFRHCDGAILTARHILTVASCRIERYPDPEEYEVVVGTVEGMVHNGTIYNLERWIIHEDYYADITKTNATIRNDIALIVTDSKIKFTKLVAPISLHRGFIKGGSQAVATGWGSFNDEKRDLKFINLRTLTNDECRKQLEKVIKDQAVPVHDFDTLCAISGKEQQGMCHNDGAPLVFEKKLIGIGTFPVIRWGKCGTGLPDGFTRISTYVKWINKKTKSH